MNKRARLFVMVLIVLISAGCDMFNSASPTIPSSANGKSTIGNIKEAVNDIISGSPGRKINGVEIYTLNGWLANVYSAWVYRPEWATVHPVPRLWTPYSFQNSFEIFEQNKQFDEYGASALVIQLNPNPVLGEVEYWKRLNLIGGQTPKPFFIAYEHINQGAGSSYIPHDGPKDMNIEANRQAFRSDIEFLFKNVIEPFQSRYITVDGRAVVYMWASELMRGDFGSLLDELRIKYPIFFIGSTTNPGHLEMLDGLMLYTLGGPNNYLVAIENYNQLSGNLSNAIRSIEIRTRKKIIFIPTFQAAYDDSKFPGRTTPVMYPKSRQEVQYHAELLKSGKGGIYSSVGPFVVYSELYEGAAVIESKCLPENSDSPSRFVGCGTDRLEILKEYFKW